MDYLGRDGNGGGLQIARDDRGATFDGRALRATVEGWGVQLHQARYPDHLPLPQVPADVAGIGVDSRLDINEDIDAVTVPTPAGGWAGVEGVPLHRRERDGCWDGDGRRGQEIDPAQVPRKPSWALGLAAMPGRYHRGE